MKRIIEGKVYNTQTAREIGSYDNGLGSGDFRSVDETLYATPRGNYFLAGSGGAMTKYSEGNGNTQWGSSKIFPLSKAEALEWCEDHGIKADVIEQEFADMIVEA